MSFVSMLRTINKLKASVAAIHAHIDDEDIINKTMEIY